MEPFLPIHWEFKSSKKQFEEQGKFYISTTLETRYKRSEESELIDVVVHNAFFDPPPPEKLNRFFIGMKIFNPRPSTVTFHEFDLANLDAINQWMVNYNKEILGGDGNNHDDR